MRKGGHCRNICISPRPLWLNEELRVIKSRSLYISAPSAFSAVSLAKRSIEKKRRKEVFAQALVLGSCISLRPPRPLRLNEELRVARCELRDIKSRSLYISAPFAFSAVNLAKRL